jgi:bifunctional non-homologous end joining protein LigD
VAGGQLQCEAAASSSPAPPRSAFALRGAAVAAPLHWAEIENGGLTPRQFTLRTIFVQLEGRDDPWADMGRHRSRLPTRLG